MSAQLPDVKSVFSQAIEIGSTADRRAFVDRACAGHPELQMKVAALLKAHGDAGSFLEAGPKELLPTAPLVTERSGSIVGPYKLLQQIGEGGFGIVYMAKQTQPMRRRVALKIIKPGMDTKEVVARFEVERQALALMDHPNIARVLDGGATETGRPYFVMELVTGVPITEFCDENKLDIPSRLRLFATVCRAIQHAHQKGVIHRDIKPSNVMVTLHDGMPIPKVIDFGVAKAITRELTARTMFTSYGQMIGTPQYMSPEQAEMSGLDVDTRSDVYSLGVLLYELLTGSTPLEIESLRGKTYQELQRIIREDDAIKPSIRFSTMRDQSATLAAQRATDPKKLGAVLRGELDWIVLKAVEKHRDRRYATANGLAADIERFLNEETVEACPPSTVYRLRKYARRNKGLLAALLAIACTLLIASGISIWLAIRATLAEGRVRDTLAKVQQERDRATEAEEREALETAIAQAVGDFLQNDLLTQASPDSEPDRDIKLRTVLDRAAARIDGKFPDQPLVEAAIRETVGKVYLGLVEYPASLTQFERSYQLRSKHLGKGHRLTLSVAANLAWVLDHLGQGNRAKAMLAEGLELARQSLGEEDPGTLQQLHNLGAWYLNHESYDDALPLFEELQKIDARHPETPQRAKLVARNSLGAVYTGIGRYDEAESQFSAVCSEAKAAGFDDLVVIAMMNLADIYTQQVKYSSAEQLLTETLAISRDRYGPTHPSTGSAMVALAEVYARGGRIDRATELHADISEIRPTRSFNAARMASYFVWAGLDEYHADLCQSMLGRARQADQANWAEHTAKAILIHPSPRRQQLLAAAEMAQKAVSMVSDQWTLCDMGMAEYRMGEFHEAADWLAQAIAVAKFPNARALIQSFQAMAAFRLGDRHRARGFLNAAEQAIGVLAAIDLPTPFLQSADLEAWLAIREARDVIGVALESNEQRVAKVFEIQRDRVKAHPDDTYARMHLAVLEYWFGHEDKYLDLCRQSLASALAGSDPFACDRAAKQYLITPDAAKDNELLEQALAAGRVAVEQGRVQELNELPWFQLCDGLASYRNRDFAIADERLSEANQAADERIRVLALLFRAMTRHEQDRDAEALKDFAAAKVLLPPFPERATVNEAILDADRMIGWLAYDEASRVLDEAVVPAGESAEVR